MFCYDFFSGDFPTLPVMLFYGVFLKLVPGFKCKITFCEVIALYWSLLKNYLLDRRMNSVGMDLKLGLCAFV